jgi:LacI family transcriptional regulator
MPTVIFATRPYIEPLLDGVADFAREHGWQLVTSMRRSGRFPTNVQPDAILATCLDAELAEKLAAFSCPIVTMLKTAVTDRLPYPLVMPDYAALGELGARHLMTLGRPHIVFYRRFNSLDSTAIRDGFERALRAADFPSHRIDFPEEYPGVADSSPDSPITQEEWHARLRARLAALHKPCAIMGEDDRFGIELITLAQQVGLRVPQDVAVLGCDNLASEIRLAPVPLSSVDANLEGVGFMAAQLLQDLLDGRPAPDRPLIAPPRGLAARASTAMFVCDDPRVAGVVCRIRAQYQEPLPIANLARDAGMSVRALQTAFKAVLHRSVRDELNRCRMECAERLLEQTDLKMTAVAAESGIGDVKSLARFFHLKHGTTLLGFRSSVREGKRHERQNGGAVRERDNQ